MKNAYNLNIKIRPIKENEIVSAVKILVQNYSKKYEKHFTNEISEMFRDGAIKPSCIIAEEEGEIVGIAGHIQSWMDYNIYRIFFSQGKFYAGRIKRKNSTCSRFLSG